MSRKAPEVTKDDKEARNVLEEIVAAARHWGKGLS